MKALSQERSGTTHLMALIEDDVTPPDGQQHLAADAQALVRGDDDATRMLQQVLQHLCLRLGLAAMRRYLVGCARTMHMSGGCGMRNSLAAEG